MALILRKLFEGYNLLFNEWSDPRTSSWPLMSSPIPIVMILGFYLYFVNNLGPKLMLHREPFELRKIMIVYNALQILVCAYVVYRGIELAWGGQYKLFCEPVDFSENQTAMSIARCVYLYFIIKVSDLLDSIFFVFRKKTSHLSFLHVYHHTGMVVLIWSSVKFLPGGHGTLLGVINSAVHVVMYTYYMLTLFDEKIKKSLWWKKHITQLQLVQFLLLVIHFSMLVVIKDCEYPPWTAAFVVPQNLFMLFLFADFYRKTYMKKTSKGLENNLKEQNGINTNIQTQDTLNQSKHVENGGSLIKTNITEERKLKVT